MLRKGSGFTLSNLISNVGLLREKEAKFYSSEIICGLEHLHAMNIAHLDLRPENVLLADSGHIFITDFDRAYDMSWETRPPRLAKVTEPLLYMAPELKNGIEVTTKADVWGLGVLFSIVVLGLWITNILLYGHEYGRSLSCDPLTPLGFLIRACLTFDHKRRMDIGGVKRHQFYEDVNWEEVVACKLEPPYHPSQLEVSDFRGQYHIDPQDDLLLGAAYRKCMPLRLITGSTFRDRHGVRHLKEKPTSRIGLLRAGFTTKKINDLFANFDFTNPHLLQSLHGVDGNQTSGANADGSVNHRQDKSADYR